MTSLRHQYDVVVVTIICLWRHWYWTIADSVWLAPPNFPWHHKLKFFHRSFRFSQTNIFSQVINYLRKNICLRKFRGSHTATYTFASILNAGQKKKKAFLASSKPLNRDKPSVEEPVHWQMAVSYQILFNSLHFLNFKTNYTSGYFKISWNLIVFICCFAK